MSDAIIWEECNLSYGYHGNDDHSFVHDGYLHLLGDFERTRNNAWGDRPELAARGIDGVQYTSMGTALAVNFDRIDEDIVRVAHIRVDSDA